MMIATPLPLCLRLDDWFWAGVDLRRVHSSRWAGPGPSALGCALLVAWRIVAFSYLFGIITYEWCCVGEAPNQHLTFLTYWGVWFVVAYLLFAALAGISALCLRGRSRSGHAPAVTDLHGTSLWEVADVHARRAAQVCFEISAAFEPVIVILYWSMLYTTGTDQTPDQYMRDVTNHAVTFSLLAVDLVLGAMRLPDRHCLVAFAAGCLYLFVNLGYTLSSGTPVYSVLTWADGSSAPLALGALAGMCVFYFLASSAAWGLDSAAAAHCCRSVPSSAGTKAEAAAFAHAAPAAAPSSGSLVADKVDLEAALAAAAVTGADKPPAATGDYGPKGALPPHPPRCCGAAGIACPGVGVAAVYTEAARAARDPFPAAFADEVLAFPCHSCPCAACRRDEE